MMNRQTFKELITNSDFKELFITELGWWNPAANLRLPEIVVDDNCYYFEPIARISSFQVLSCKVDNIPTSALCKKIDTQLRKQANNYICIYYVPNTQHHLWVVPVKKVEKRDLVLIEYDSAEKASFLFEKMSDLQFDEDEQPTIMDVKERVQAGFIVNSEKITKDFYTGFRKEHTNFAKFISGIDDEITELKNNRNKQWYTSVMLNRLMFCYFIQKKGFLDRNVNYLRDKLTWVKSEKGSDRFYGSFYRGFLLSMFHDGLNTPRHQPDFVQKYGRIPYLNGGMFSTHELEEQYPTIDIADEAFESLFAFFDQWHWHLDDRLTASGKDINPDVLGYIFEQYINDRAQMGAYYTKEDITEYIGRNTILPFLMDATKKMDEKPFKANGAVWQFLRESGDSYIFDAVKKGKDEEIPEDIAIGIDTTKPNLLERRSHWNEKTPEAFALPTEIWRETIERLQRYNTIKAKIENGEITEINDFITYNLDIRQFVQDLLANTDDHLFVKHFYAELRKVTILDPTCGSGAFLFAALNILEPLYEVCIDRMQNWNRDNSNLFKEELEELNGKYRSNIRYFIYKNIILRNLYGVDIMVEATEIAKLRLFLKMVAVVDVNPREDNLGLDPLPDIDFNIRCGNTLVGYATKDNLEKDLVEGDMFANMDFKDKVHEEMDVVAHAYTTFKNIQLEQDIDLETFKNAKIELKKRLKHLDELLNQKLYASTVFGGSLKYDAWLKSHQPFHWLAEYYDIINGNGGFDVIIGNPPYVVYRENDFEYKVSSLYKTLPCSNLYAFVVERSMNIGGNKGRFSMIIPMSIVTTQRMMHLQRVMYNNNSLVSMFHLAGDWHPGRLFEGVRSQFTVIISQRKDLLNDEEQNFYTTDYLRWYTEERSNLFTAKLRLCKNNNFSFNDNYPKIGHSLEKSIIKKVLSNVSISSLCTRYGNGTMYYRNAGIAYYLIAINFKQRFYINGIREQSSTLKPIYSENQDVSNILTSIINSNIFGLLYFIYSDCYHFTNTDFNRFCYTIKSGTKEFNKLCSRLMDSINKNSIDKTAYYKTKGEVVYQEFYPRRSKPIIDEIDKVLAKHYGFTEEELDFIINYDIKYRMGDELNEE